MRDNGDFWPMDWQQRRALEFLADRGEGLLGENGNGMVLVGMEGVKLTAVQIGEMLAAGHIEFSADRSTAFAITEAGRSALANARERELMLGSPT